MTFRNECIQLSSFSTWREEEWKRKLKALPQSTRLNITPEEKLPPGSNSGWTRWRCLNRLRTGVARTKTELKKWGFVDPATNTTCQCGDDDDTVQHRSKCSLLDEPWSTTDLCQFNENARRFVELWKTSI